MEKKFLMTDPNYPLINGLIGNNRALHETITAKTEAITIAEQRRREATAEAEHQQLKARTALRDNDDLSFQLSRAYARGSRESKRADAEAKRADELALALAERDAIILEWMQSNEAFRRLAREYGKELGVTDEQRTKDFDEHLLDVAEEDPDFKNTKATAKAKKRLGLT